jgi:ankyrin repeat protein
MLEHNTAHNPTPPKLEGPLSAWHQQLDQAVGRRDITTLQELLDKGVDPACRNGQIFFKAASDGFGAGAKLLFSTALSRGSDLSHLVTPALLAHFDSKSLDGETIAFLLRAGATLNKHIANRLAPNDHGAPPYGEPACICFRRLVCESSAARLSESQNALSFALGFLGALEAFDKLTAEEIELDVTVACGAAAFACRMDAVEGFRVRGGTYQAPTPRTPTPRESVSINPPERPQECTLVSNNGYAWDFTRREDREKFFNSPAVRNEQLNPTVEGITAIIETCPPQIVRKLIEIGFDFSAYHGAAIQNAAEQDLQGTVALLIKHTRDRSTLGYNEALLSAIRNHSYRLAKLLIKNGADPRFNNDEPLWELGMSPSWDKTQYRGVEFAKYLVRLGADVTAYDNRLLRRAVQHGNIPMVKWLLSQRVSPLPYSAELALSVVREKHPIDLLGLLIDHGLDLSDKNCRALHRVARHGTREEFRFLLDHDAGAFQDLRSPLRIAAAANNYGIVKLLLGKGIRCPHALTSAIEQYADLRTIALLLDSLEPHERPEAVEIKANYGARKGSLSALLARYQVRPVFVEGNRHPAERYTRRFTEKPLAIAKAFARSMPDPDEVIQALPLTPMQQNLVALYREFRIPKQEQDPVKVSRLLLEKIDSSRLSDGFINSLFSGVPGKSSTLLLSLGSLAAKVAAKEAGNVDAAREIFRELLGNTLKELNAKHSRNPLGQSIRQLSLNIRASESISDAVKRVATELYLPLWARELQDNSRLKALRQDQVNRLSDSACAFALKQVTAGRSLHDLVKFSGKLHEPGTANPASTRPYLTALEWPVLFFGTVNLSNDFSIVVLKNQSELAEEGRILKHCVGDGGYASPCASGQNQILSLRYKGQRHATIQLFRDASSGVLESPGGLVWGLGQFQGLKHSAATASARKAFDEFLSLVKEEKVALDPEYRSKLALTQSFTQTIPPFERLTGMPLEEPEHVDTILEHYQKLGVWLKREIVPDPLTTIPEMMRALEIDQLTS